MFGTGHTTSHSVTARNRETGERVKGTFNGDMVAHVWAQRTQTFGKSGNGNLYFESDALYSYGTHYLAAYLLPIGAEIVALINMESRSPTTARHVSTARRASRQFRQVEVPELTELREALPALGEFAGRASDLRKQADGWHVAYSADGDYSAACATYDRRAYAAVSRVRDWLAKIDAAECPEAVDVLATAAGLRKAEVRTIQRERARKIADRKKEHAKMQRLFDIREAENMAAFPRDEWRATWPNDGDSVGSRSGGKPWELRKLEDMARRLHQLARVATAARKPKIAAEIRERHKILRAHIKGRDARIIARARKQAADRIRAWRAGGRRPESWRYQSHPAIHRALESAEIAERAAQWAAEFAAWQTGTGKRPFAGHYVEGSPERLAIETAERAEIAERESQYLAWRADRTLPRPPANAFLGSYRPTSWVASDGATLSGYYFPDTYAAEFAERFPFARAFGELHDAEAAEKFEREQAERAERARLAYAAEAERREAWLAGSLAVRWSGSDSNGGALMRIRGDMLETSQGASVPLAHAIKVFRFVKLCRERGEPWKRNGKTIRVGHFQVDSISATGDFKAGCHTFNWAEVERVAALAGIAEAEASAEALEIN